MSYENFWRKFFIVAPNSRVEFAFESDERFHRNIYFSELEPLIAEIYKHFGNNEYYGIYPTNEYGEPWIDRIFFDFDAVIGKEKKEFDPLSEEGKKLLEECWNEVKRFVEWLEDRYNAKPLVLYSGHRGFHVYVFTIRAILKHPRETLREYCEKITEACKLKFVDRAIFGDVRRVARIPYTKHAKTGLFCYPVDTSWSIEEILEKAKNPPVVEPSFTVSEILRNELWELDKMIIARIREALKKQVAITEIRPVGGYTGLPCIRQLLKTELYPRDMTPSGKMGRRTVAAKYLAMAYYLDHGTMDGFDIWIDVWIKRQNIGHPLRKSEVLGWVRGIQKWITEGRLPEWNCAEIRKYLIEQGLPVLCSSECPYVIAYQEYLERKKEEKLASLFRNFELIKLVDKLTNKYIIGEKKNKLLLFLLLLNNQNVFVVGDTSSGKTNLVEGVLRIFKGGNDKDEEIVAEVSAMTEKALRWVEKDRLPILYIKEMPPELARFNITNSMGMDLKLAMSDKKIIFWFTDTSTGTPIKREREIYVDAIVWTTTATELPEDFENRAWILSTDDSPELTEKVVEWKAEKASKLIEDDDPSFQLEMQTVHEAIKLLRRKKWKVIIPFAKSLTKLVNTQLTRARRDIDKILDLVAAVAKTNYMQRLYRFKPTENEIIIAHPLDAMYAIGLIKEMFPKMQVGLDRRIERAYNTLREMEREKEENSNFEDTRITVAEFAARLMISQPTARQLLKTLVYKGLAREEKVGNKNMYSSVPIDLKLAKLDFSEIYQEYDDWMKEHEEYLEQVEF